MRLSSREVRAAVSRKRRGLRDDVRAVYERVRVDAEHGEAVGTRLARRWSDAWPEAYKEDFSPATAAVDLSRLEALAAAHADGQDAIDLVVHQEVDAGRGEARLKVYRIGRHLSLSEILPMLSSTGVEVVDELAVEDKMTGEQSPEHRRHRRRRRRRRWR